MKRRMLSLLLIAVVVLGMLPTTVLAAPAQNGGIYQIIDNDILVFFHLAAFPASRFKSLGNGFLCLGTASAKTITQFF